MAVKLKKSQALAALSITPLIDVVFLLLIFFMVTSRFAKEERELQVELPQASEARPASARHNELFINIDKQGRYFVDGRMLDAGQLEAVFQAAIRDNPQGQPVNLRAAGTVALQHAVVVINLCKRYGFHDFQMSTDAQSK